MLFMAEFGKHADKPEAFRSAFNPHLAYLKEQRDRILLSATKYDPSTNAVLGFMWIIDVNDAAAAETLCRNDPFWAAGLRTSFHLCALTKAIPEQVATI